MAGGFGLRVVTPEGEVWSGIAESVVVPGLDGYFGVWKGHSPLIAALDVGAVMIKVPGESAISFVAVTGGFVEVNPEGVTILAESAELGEEIDLVRAQDAEKRARERLEKFFSETDVNRAMESVRRAIARKHIAERVKQKPTQMF
jgi:F-type H+-transporting ATPase subunit epsilon